MTTMSMKYLPAMKKFRKVPAMKLRVQSGAGAGAGLSQREGIATLAADEAISGSRLLSR